MWGRQNPWQLQPRLHAARLQVCHRCLYVAMMLIYWDWGYAVLSYMFQQHAAGDGTSLEGSPEGFTS